VENHRFDPAALAAAAQTQRRMQSLWAAWLEHPATPTLVFCCSIEHARFAATWLAERGVRVDSVFAGPASGDRSECVARLARGELDALCVVDMFNEGVDIPAVDRVVMLRPTESPVVFLQQLGRGLRKCEGKERLTIIDFVGNHEMFLGRIRRLLSLVSSSSSVRAYLESTAAPELPPGCSIDLELEIKQLLQTFLRPGALEVERVYRELVRERGERPSIGELYRMGYRPSTLRREHDGWFRFVAGEGDLDGDEMRALEAVGGWFEELEAGAMGDALPLVVIEVLLEADGLATGMPIDEVAQRSLAFLARSPELVRGVDGLGEHMAAPPAEWLAFWRDNPIAGWTRGHGWFAVEGERFVPRRLAVPAGLDAALARMTRELVDYRLHLYRARTSPDAAGNAFSCIVLWNKREPILKLPRRSANPHLPTAEIDVRLSDGAVWRFRFAKEFINVAYPVGTASNRLPDLMRTWFGPNAGHPGTRFEVHFSRSPDGWWIEPLGKSLSQTARGRFVAFPCLRAAAGVAAGGRPDAPEAEEVTLPFHGGGDDVFAVRASGDSMNGGKMPIADGDWLVMRWARGASVASLEGRVALVQTPDGQDTFAYQVKRIVREGERWWLRSDNPEGPSIEATAETIPIARLVARIAPETMAPGVGEWLEPERVAATFGLASEGGVERNGRRDGHLFIVVTEPGGFSEADRLAVVIGDRRPGETAFVLARPEGEQRWRYCGVGRWLEDEQRWAIPPLDFAIWRALGKGRDCSRRLPDGAKARANAFLDELFQRAGAGAWIVHDGKRCRLVERTAGGVRIDGGEGGFAGRLVSVTDLAWVMIAADGVAASGGVLDEARVNRGRYLEGTPKGSTRWIDTGWGIVIFIWDWRGLID
jgi:hypothetical protein